MNSSPTPLTQGPKVTQNPQPILTQNNVQASSLFGNSTQKDKMMMVPATGSQPVPYYSVEFSGPSTNFVFSQPGSYNITMGPAPPAYQQEYP